MSSKHKQGNNILSNAIKFSDPSRSSEGNGLGMALDLRVVNLLKGSITVESALGKEMKMMVELRRYK